jgi:hypothetical protein
LQGALTAEAFIAMSPDELANQKLKEERRVTQELAKADLRKDISVEDMLTKNLSEDDPVDELDLL